MSQKILMIKVDSLVLPICSPKQSGFRGGSFLKDRSIGAGQVKHENNAKSFLRKAGHR